MTIDIFDKLYMSGEYEELQQKIDAGLEIPKDENYSWNETLRTAYTSNDFHQLHFLWKNKLGKKLNKGMKEIFKSFENGEDPSQLTDALNKKDTVRKESIGQHFNSSNFDLKKLVFESSSLTIEEDYKDKVLIKLELVIQEFIYNKHITNTEMVFSAYVNSKELELILTRGYSIPRNKDGWDSSIYIESADNTAVLQFLKVNQEANSIYINIHFDFETNKTGLDNQKLQKELSTTLNISKY